jgi:hypothetical protein
MKSILVLLDTTTTPAPNERQRIAPQLSNWLRKDQRKETRSGEEPDQASVKISHMAIVPRAAPAGDLCLLLARQRYGFQTAHG